jgi:hypothetical protein
MAIQKLGKRLGTAVVVVWCAFPLLGNAQTGGGAFLAVEDGTSHGCIDVSKYNVSMMVVAIQGKRTDTFWKRSKTLGVKLDVVLTNQDGKLFTFPRGIQINAREISGDIATLPAKFTIMSKYSLYGDKAYVNVGLNVYMINIETASQAARGMTQLIEFSKNLPLPANPYVPGMQLFGDFVQKLVSDDIQSVEEKEPVAAFSFDLASSDEDVRNCPATGLREGINAVVFEHSGSGEGVLRLDDLRSHCYYFDEATSRMVYRRKANGTCSKDQRATVLRNPLVAFLVGKWSRSPASTNPVAALRGAKPVAPERQESGVGRVTDAGARLALNKHTRIGDLGEKLESANVKAIVDALSRQGAENSLETTLSGFDNTSPAARVIEAETALNLHVCALAGVSAGECP